MTPPCACLQGDQQGPVINEEQAATCLQQHWQPATSIQHQSTPPVATDISTRGPLPTGHGMHASAKPLGPGPTKAAGTTCATEAAESVPHSSLASKQPPNDAAPPGAMSVRVEQQPADVYADVHAAHTFPVNISRAPSTEASPESTPPADAASYATPSTGQHDTGQSTFAGDGTVGDDGEVGVHNGPVEGAAYGDVPPRGTQPEAQQEAQGLVSEYFEGEGGSESSTSGSLSQRAHHPACGTNSVPMCQDAAGGPLGAVIEPSWASQAQFPDLNPSRSSLAARTCCVTPEQSVRPDAHAMHATGPHLHDEYHEGAAPEVQSGHEACCKASGHSTVSPNVEFGRSSYGREGEIEQQVPHAPGQDSNEPALDTGRQSRVDSDDSAFVEFVKACEGEVGAPHAATFPTTPQLQGVASGTAIEAQAAVLSEQLADVDSALSFVMHQLRSSHQGALLASPGADSRSLGAATAAVSEALEGLDADKDIDSEHDSPGCVVGTAPGTVAAQEEEESLRCGHDDSDRDNVPLQDHLGALQSVARHSGTLEQEHEETPSQDRAESFETGVA